MKILVKFPTRERPTKCIARLDEIYSLASDPKSVTTLVSYDHNDPSMNQEWVKNSLAKYNVIAVRGSSSSKIHAVNRDMEMSGNWDIGVLLSDDMVCQMKGWDDRLREDMTKHFPDTMGALWYWDGDQNTRLTFDHRGIRSKGLCTMNIFGRKYYDWRGNWYDPRFKSLWCDNMETDIMMNEHGNYYEGKGKYHYSEDVMFRHVHYSNTQSEQPDRLMKHTQTFYSVDQVTYNYLKLQNHGLPIANKSQVK